MPLCKKKEEKYLFIYLFIMLLDNCVDQLGPASHSEVRLCARNALNPVQHISSLFLK